MEGGCLLSKTLNELLRWIEWTIPGDEEEFICATRIGRLNDWKLGLVKIGCAIYDSDVIRVEVYLEFSFHLVLAGFWFDLVNFVLILG